MELPSGKVWLQQALSDLDCARFLETKPELRCHAIAKYQQSVEKGVKALAAAVNDNTKTQITIQFNHDVESYINVMQRLPLKRNSNIPQRIRSLFNVRDMHVLVSLPATIGYATLVKNMKAGSSRLVSQELKPGEWFAWQGHYGAFSLRKKDLAKITAYIDNQKQHHNGGDLWPHAEETYEEICDTADEKIKGNVEQTNEPA